MSHLVILFRKYFGASAAGVGGPFCTVAGEAYQAGAVAGEAYQAGAVAGEVYQAGAVQGEGCD